MELTCKSQLLNLTSYLLWSHTDPALELLKYFQSFISDCICHYFATLLELLLLDFVFSYACTFKDVVALCVD